MERNERYEWLVTLPEQFEKQLVIAECGERSQGNSVPAPELLNIN